MAGIGARVKRTHNFNNFEKAARILKKNSPRNDRIMEHFVALVRKIARQSIKKAPKATPKKNRFGTYKKSGRNTKRYKNADPSLGLTRGQYFSKGLYSRPGSPPFWHPGSAKGKADLRSIEYAKLQHAHYRVGVTYLGGFGKPIPGLHEHGGSKTVKTKTYYDRAGRKHRRVNVTQARYPARPYMAPAIKAAKQRRLRGGKTLLEYINSMGGFTPVKKAT